MTTRGYTVLGCQLAQNKVKLGAAAPVFAVIAAGIAAARASSDNG